MKKSFGNSSPGNRNLIPGIDKSIHKNFIRCMAISPKNKKALIVGVGLDADGSRRVTTGPNFALVGGSEATHELMTEKAIKINEQLKKRGKVLEEVSAAEFADIAGEVGLQGIKRR